jgi:23S rRNA pseudouridine1911/1915/1917 synthase
MPSKNMLPKGKRRQTVKPLYRATRGVEPPPPPAIPPPPVIPTLEPEDDRDPQTPLDPHQLRNFTTPPEAAGLRLDQYLAQAIPDISRSRAQLLIDSGQVRVNHQSTKSSLKLVGGETIEIEGTPRPEPLHAFPEDIPLNILFEDDHLAVIDKPAGMMVHAGAGAASDPETPDPRTHGTLVNALLHHFSKLSHLNGDLRPGIVHRLDKQTSGLILVAKDDSTHRKFGDMFANREIDKTYIALVHGHIAKGDVTVNLPIARDLLRRTRMTTRRSIESGARPAVSHIHVLERINSPYGPFTLVQVKIETGRTHQIRVHLQSVGHPVVGDHLYGAPHIIHNPLEPTVSLTLDRNFLHAAQLSFTHPKTRKPISINAPLPPELKAFLNTLKSTPNVLPPKSNPRKKRRI